MRWCSRRLAPHTTLDRCRDASARSVTLIELRARIPVIAWSGAVGLNASDGRVAETVGAGVSVVAIERRTAGALTLRARIVGRTGTAVIARRGIVDVEATAGGIAEVIGAAIAVTTVPRAAADASTPRAGVVDGAGVAVVTSAGHAGVLTDFADTGVGRADVAVVAVRVNRAVKAGIDGVVASLPRTRIAGSDAGSIAARIGQRAKQPVVAR